MPPLLSALLIFPGCIFLAIIINLLFTIKPTPTNRLLSQLLGNCLVSFALICLFIINFVNFICFCLEPPKEEIIEKRVAQVQTIDSVDFLIFSSYDKSEMICKNLNFMYGKDFENEQNITILWKKKLSGRVGFIKYKELGPFYEIDLE